MYSTVPLDNPSKKSLFADFLSSFQIIMNVSNKFPHNITITSSNDTFYFEPIMTDELGLCYSFNSRISSFLSPEYSSLLAYFASRNFLINFFRVLCSPKSFLVSANARNLSRLKLLEEINYFDGDASAVTAGLTNNVDVTMMSFFSGFSTPPSQAPPTARTSNFSTLSRTIVIHLLTYKHYTAPST